MTTKPSNGLGTTKVAVMMPAGLRSEATREPVRETAYQPQPVTAVAEKEVVEQPVEHNAYNGYHRAKKNRNPK